jgi:hypothetical protein
VPRSANCPTPPSCDRLDDLNKPRLASPQMSSKNVRRIVSVISGVSNLTKIKQARFSGFELQPAFRESRLFPSCSNITSLTWWVRVTLHRERPEHESVFKGPIHDQSCCTTRNVAQHDWSCMGPFSLFSLFWKIKVGLWYHVAVCVCVSPYRLLGNGSVEIPLFLVRNSSIKIPLSFLGNGSVETLPR